MTSRAAVSAAKTTTAPGGNPTPSVEQFNGSQQIGTLIMSIAEGADTRQADFSRPAAPSSAELGQQIAARIATELPSIAAKISTPELAQVMAQAITQAGSLPGPRAAADRGPEWMARYNCPGWCVLDHAGADGEPGWHQGVCAEAVAPKPFEDHEPGDANALVLAARVTQLSEHPEVFGITTRLWVDVDCETLELDVEQTDVLIARLEAFLPQLRAMRGHLAEVAKDDRPENPEAKAAWLAAPAVPVTK